MSESHPPHSAEFLQRMIELARIGRTAKQLSRKVSRKA